MGDEEFKGASRVTESATKLKKTFIRQCFTDGIGTYFGLIDGETSLVLIVKDAQLQDMRILLWRKETTHFCKNALANVSRVACVGNVDVDISLRVCGDEDKDSVCWTWVLGRPDGSIWGGGWGRGRFFDCRRAGGGGR